MLTLYRRHKPTCPQFAEGRKSHNRCKCKIWADGVLGGQEVRRAMGTRDWTKANRQVQEWEAAERMSERGAPVTLVEAWKSLIADLEARKLSPETIRKYKSLALRMTDFSADKGLSLLADFGVDTLSRFRATWPDGPRTAGKNLERLKAFFRFALERKWIESNPAKLLRPPKVAACPTMPLTSDEMIKILAACDTLQNTTHASGRMNVRRLKALVLLMRYSGIRISDAVALTTDRLDGKKLFLYTAKTGVPIYTVLPDSVLHALEATPRVAGNYYFWTGEGKIESIVRSWQARVK